MKTRFQPKLIIGPVSKDHKYLFRLSELQLKSNLTILGNLNYQRNKKQDFT